MWFISLIVSPIILLSGIIYGFYDGFKNQHIGIGFKNADTKFMFMAKSIDKYGNAICSELFNALLITKQSKHHFGDISQTISMVIGYNFLEGTLSKTGKLVNHILNFIDKDHSLKAIKDKS